MKKTAIFLICLSVFLSTVFGVLYRVDMYKMDNNEAVVFSTWGMDYAPVEVSEIENIDYSNTVYIKIDDSTVNPRGLNAYIVNNTDKDVAFLDYYRIEVKRGSEWYHCDIIPELRPSWSDITYIVGVDAEAEIAFYWPELYGELSQGEYRLVKEYYDNADTSNRIHYLYGLFTIN